MLTYLIFSRSRNSFSFLTGISVLLPFNPVPTLNPFAKESSGRSADLQSAVSPICNRQRVENNGHSGVLARSAECNSAIQQIANLRYAIKNKRLLQCPDFARLRHRSNPIIPRRVIRHFHVRELERAGVRKYWRTI